MGMVFNIYLINFQYDKKKKKKSYPQVVSSFSNSAHCMNVQESGCRRWHLVNVWL